ncbi:MAG: alpha/beta fold hydrolase [Rhodothalassiaceae bacterium]
MQSKKIMFQGTQGQLAARLDLPASRPRGYALFAHCFTCSKDIFAASRIAEGLADMGVATLRFDFTGLGMSEGEFANTNFTSNVDDLLRAAEYMREELQAPKLLVGHSLGGAAVLAAAGEIAEVEAVATIGAPFDPEHVSHNFGDKIQEIEAAGEAEVKLAGRPFRVRKQFLEDIRSQNQAERIRALRKPIAIFHSPIDDTVGIDNAGNIFQTAKHPKSFITLDKADHLLTNREDAIYVARTLVAWASRYISGLADDGRNLPFKPQPEDVLVAETRRSKFQQTVAVRGHRIYADEPLSIGGDNTGPTPYDLLLAGLGACTNMTLRLYADRRGVPLTRASVKLTHEKRHVEDCEACLETGKPAKLDHIDRELILEGELTEEQRSKLVEIADKCPVHRTLHSEIRISTRLRDG